MNVSVGLCEGRAAVEVELRGTFTDPVDNRYGPGRHRFTSEIVLTPSEMSSCAFALDDITIGIGFHWERKERQVHHVTFTSATVGMMGPRGVTARSNDARARISFGTRIR